MLFSNAQFNKLTPPFKIQRESYSSQDTTPQCLHLSLNSCRASYCTSGMHHCLRSNSTYTYLNRSGEGNMLTRKRSEA